jgi:hypothetical protein
MVRLGRVLSCIVIVLSCIVLSYSVLSSTETQRGEQELADLELNGLPEMMETQRGRSIAPLNGLPEIDKLGIECTFSLFVSLPAPPRTPQLIRGSLIWLRDIFRGWWSYLSSWRQFELHNSRRTSFLLLVSLDLWQAANKFMACYRDMISLLVLLAKPITGAYIF